MEHICWSWTEKRFPIMHYCLSEPSTSAFIWLHFLLCYSDQSDQSPYCTWPVYTIQTKMISLFSPFFIFVFHYDFFFSFLPRLVCFWICSFPFDNPLCLFLVNPPLFVFFRIILWLLFDGFHFPFNGFHFLIFRYFFFFFSLLSSCLSFIYITSFFRVFKFTFSFLFLSY